MSLENFLAGICERPDEVADRMLEAKGYRHDSVPPAGEIVYLRKTANLSTGGTAIDVTDGDLPVPGSAEVTFSDGTGTACGDTLLPPVGLNGWTVTPFLGGFVAGPLSFGNVNFPACTPDQVKGVRVTRQGKRNLGFLKVDKRHDGRGNPYFWIGFERAAMMDTPAEGTDLAALAARYVSVTPLRVDRTDEAFSAALTTTLK